MRPISNMRAVKANSHLNGAALVSSDGKEIAITESMIQRAFEQFEKGSNFHPSSLMIQAKAFKTHQRQRPFRLRLV